MMMSKMWLSGSITLFAGLAFVAACGAAGTEKDMAAAEPIAEVTLASGSVVSFFEPSPGEILVEQEVPLGVAPVSQSQLSAVDFYAALAPGEVPPSALIAAQARQNAARAERSPAREANGRDAGGREATILSNGAPSGSGAQFDNNVFASLYCSGGWDAKWCRFDQHGPFFTTYSSVDEAFWAVCAEVGSVRLRIKIGGSLLKDVDVLPGTCFWDHWTSGLFNSSASGEVYDVASTDQYDVAMLYEF